jgi:hypothetical protein
MELTTLTTKETELYKNGLLSKSLFKYLILELDDFYNYLYRYCKIISDYRTELLRETTFLHYDIEVTVLMKLGVCIEISYKEKIPNKRK